MFEFIIPSMTLRERGDIMDLDYKQIGKRIAARRKTLKLTQTQVEEKADLAYKYLSNIERGVSIPSTEVIMRLAIALETTPDEFLVGSVRQHDEGWKDVAEKLRTLDEKQLKLADHFITWVAGEKL